MPPQAGYFGHIDGHHDWVNGQQERQGAGPGPTRPFGGDTLSNFTHSVSASLDPFAGEVAMPSQMDYGTGYTGIFKS